jgi:hypothetical protein
MRTLRVLVAGAVIPLLAISLSVAVAAQEEADPMAPASFTYTTEPVEESHTPEGPEGMEVRDYRYIEKQEATDPRASGLVTITANWDMVDTAGEGGFMTAALSERLTNDGGAWSGTGRFVMAMAEDGGMMGGMDVLTGEGGYEGLTLIMGQFGSDGAMTNWGVIVPSDQVPPMPDPIEPAE